MTTEDSKLTNDSAMLAPTLQNLHQLSWEETAKAMAAAKEDWSEWECISADALSRC